MWFAQRLRESNMFYINSRTGMHRPHQANTSVHAQPPCNKRSPPKARPCIINSQNLGEKGSSGRIYANLVMQAKFRLQFCFFKSLQLSTRSRIRQSAGGCMILKIEKCRLLTCIKRHIVRSADNHFVHACVCVCVCVCVCGGAAMRRSMQNWTFGRFD